MCFVRFFRLQPRIPLLLLNALSVAILLVAVHVYVSPLPFQSPAKVIHWQEWGGYSRVTRGAVTMSASHVLVIKCPFGGEGVLCPPNVLILVLKSIGQWKPH